MSSTQVALRRSDAPPEVAQRSKRCTARNGASLEVAHRGRWRTVDVRGFARPTLTGTSHIARETSLRPCFSPGHVMRQELAQQLKAEKLAALKDRAPLANRDAQRKREEKEARQAAKAKGPKARLMKM